MRWALAVLVLNGLANCGRSSEPSGAGSGSGAPKVSAPAGRDAAVDAGELSAADRAARVRAAFPKGVASEDVRAQIGTPPVAPDRPMDPSASWIAEIKLPRPLDDETVAEKLRAANLQLPSERYHLLMGRSGGAWLYVEDAQKPGTMYDRIALTVSVVDDKLPVDAVDLASEADWMRELAKALGGSAPTFSTTIDKAVLRGAAVLSLARRFGTWGEVEVRIEGKTSGRMLWDSAYAAGFEWGDGDYLRLGGITILERVAPEKLDDKENIALELYVPGAFEPEKAFDVMIRAGTYIATRTGGHLQGIESARDRMNAIVAALRAADVTPGGELALTVFRE